MRDVYIRTLWMPSRTIPLASSTNGPHLLCEGGGCAPLSLKLFYNFRPAFFFPPLNYDRFVWWRLPRLPSLPCFQEERERDFSSVQVAHLRTLLPSRRKKISTCVWALFNLTGRGGGISGRGKAGKVELINRNISSSRSVYSAIFFVERKATLVESFFFTRIYK